MPYRKYYFLPETRAKYWDYFLLSAQVLLAWTLLRYGWAKLNDQQFGVNEKVLNMPLKSVGLFKLSWYLADHEPFKSFIGVSQIVTGLLMLWPKTALIGTLLSIPIWLNILFWDMTFMEGFTDAFQFRLSYYLVLSGLIIYHYRTHSYPALRSLYIADIKITYPVWTYFLLPIMAVGVEVIGGLLRWIL
ncbi:hypothetical protein GO755_27795 [Spirosoma sp. HMF4905]|uniref:DoxX family membrane protein n=1 Tax=Spirosoma arboris TaxID=2682092 RepID=A0A7K1SJ75_9BACT|nr:hypothetical protein [Spirosoma arboris]MVM33871.1 hypothetical protein [Spirosoma arboris]